MSIDEQKSLIGRMILLREQVDQITANMQRIHRRVTFLEQVDALRNSAEEM